MIGPIHCIPQVSIQLLNIYWALICSISTTNANITWRGTGKLWSQYLGYFVSLYTSYITCNSFSSPYSAQVVGISNSSMPFMKWHILRSKDHIQYRFAAWWIAAHVINHLVEENIPTIINAEILDFQVTNFLKLCNSRFEV